MTDKFDIFDNGENEADEYRLCSSCKTLKAGVVWRGTSYLCDGCAY